MNLCNSARILALAFLGVRQALQVLWEDSPAEHELPGLAKTLTKDLAKRSCYNTAFPVFLKTLIEKFAELPVPVAVAELPVPVVAHKDGSKLGTTVAPKKLKVADDSKAPKKMKKKKGSSS